MLTPVTLPCYLAINQSESCAWADRIPPLPGEEGPPATHFVFKSV